MRIATWNINGVRARLGFVALWLAERKPDVLALQELKSEDETFPHGFFGELGYEVHTHGQKSWNGVGLIVPQGREVEVIQRGLPGREDNGSRLITAKIGDITYTSVYCPNGKNPEHADFQMKLEWFDALTEYWSDLIRQYPASAIGGDFNIVPTSRDTWRGKEGDGEMFHTENERDRLRNFVDANLHDLYRELNPGSVQHSWWDYRGGAFERSQGLRIDMIYGTPEIRARTESVEIDRHYRERKEEMTPSDHVPVIAQLAD